MLSPGARVERYEVVQELGQGGMAVVYLVRHTSLDTLHALKVLTLSGDLVQERLRSEGRVQAQIRHENVVRVSDVLEVGGRPALVMDYVDGPDLYGWLRTVHPDPALAEEVFRGILAGVQSAHLAGVVHRDLKPANVLMAPAPQGQSIPRVSDFGIVKLLTGDAAAASRTGSGIPLGTPEYMAPEQIRDPSRVDRRADLFSLGCILYELLAGRPAFGGANVLAVFQAIEDCDYPPLPARVPARLVKVVAACLRHNPDDRPPDCAAIFAMLDAAPAERVQAREPRPVGVWLAALGLLGGTAAFAAVAVTAGVIVWRAWPQRDGLEPAPIAAPTPLLQIDREPVPVPPPPPEPGAPVAPRRPPPTETPEPETTVPELPPVPVAEPEPEWVDGDCPGVRGEVVGWFEARPVRVLGVDPPTLGRMYDVSVQRTVFADYPRPQNGGQNGAPVCKLIAGTRIRVERPPVQIGKSYWVPLVAGAVDPE